MMKNYTILAIGALCALSANAAWDGSAQEWTQGDGSKGNPYLIENEQHLAYLQQQVTAGNSYKDTYFLMTADMDMSGDAGQKILPIGFFDEYVNPDDPQGSLIDESKYFLGTFDGGFHVIDNIYIEYIGTDFEAVGGTGLFACLDDGSVVQNLGLGSRAVVVGGELTASLVGQMNGGIVKNCYSSATVNSGSSFGSAGLVAVSSGGYIEKCYFNGTVKGNSDVGGIVGTAQYGAEIVNCYNAGVIDAPNGWYVGGIVGSAYDSGTRIVNCYNVGEVIATESFISSPQAIAGDAEYKVLVQNCYFLDNGSFEEASGVMKKSDEEMKSDNMPILLNAGDAAAPWQVDSKSLNNGYPVLAWQNDPSAGIAVQAIGNLAVGVQNGTIYLYGIDDNAEVAIYNTVGALVYSGRGNAINLAQCGIYVVVADGKVAKVRL